MSPRCGTLSRVPPQHALPLKWSTRAGKKICKHGFNYDDIKLSLSKRFTACKLFLSGLWKFAVDVYTPHTDLNPHAKFESLVDMALVDVFTRQTSVNVCLYYECLNGLRAAMTES